MQWLPALLAGLERDSAIFVDGVALKRTTGRGRFARDG
jgi:hypothetical protein